MSVFIGFSRGGGAPESARTRFAACRSYRNGATVRSRRSGWTLGDLGQKLVVALGGADLVQQELQAGGGAAVVGQGVEHPGELPDLLKLGLVEEQFFVAGGAGIDVDRRVDPPLGQSPVEPELHVAGALELLENDLVHFGAGLHQGGGQDGERPALFDVAGRPEELLRWVQGTRVDATGHDPAGRGLGQVVGPGQSGDAVENDHDVPAHFHQPLRPLDGQFSHRGVLVGRTIEGGGNHFALDRTTHVGDLFGALVHQKDHEVHVGVVGFDGLGDVLHPRRLAGLRRRDDQSPLTLADWRKQIDDPRRHVLLIARRLEVETLIREEGGQVLKPGAVAGLFRIEPGDHVDTQQRRELLGVSGRAARTLEIVAFAKGKTPRLADGYIHVLDGREVPVAPEESVALVAEVEQAAHRDELALVWLLLIATCPLEVALAALTWTVAATTAAIVTPIAGVVVAPALAVVLVSLTVALVSLTVALVALAIALPALVVLAAALVSLVSLTVALSTLATGSVLIILTTLVLAVLAAFICGPGCRSVISGRHRDLARRLTGLAVVSHIDLRRFSVIVRAEGESGCRASPCASSGR